jgi:hypothetical protein
VIFPAERVAADAAALLMALATAITPPPELRISEWAEGRLDIPGETGTDRPGPLSWEGFEYAIEPLDRHHQDDPCRDVVFRGSAQIAKTTIGVIDDPVLLGEVPRPWGVALPSTDEVLKYNRSKWQPIVDATPELRRKVRAGLQPRRAGLHQHLQALLRRLRPVLRRRLAQGPADGVALPRGLRGDPQLGTRGRRPRRSPRPDPQASAPLGAGRRQDLPQRHARPGPPREG